MSSSTDENTPVQERFAQVFEQLRDQDIEHFYANYQLWFLRHRVPIIERQIETLREHLEENQGKIDDLRPSAIALAVLARLQANDVSDVALLERMLDRGEDWLDRMMQRLDYCEQVQDFIQGNYTQWCINSLEGAYDWIDSLRSSPPLEEEILPSQESDPLADEAEVLATEELLLQKLGTEDEKAMLEMTLRLAVENPLNEASVTENLARNDAVLDVVPDEVSGDAGELMPIPADSSSPELQIDPPPLSEASDVVEQEQDEKLTLPWYSLNLERNESEPVSMDDWINVLQADTAARMAAGEGEVTEYSADEIVPRENVLLSSDALPTDEHVGLSPVDETVSGLDDVEAPELIDETTTEDSAVEVFQSTLQAALEAIEDEIHPAEEESGSGEIEHGSDRYKHVDVAEETPSIGTSEEYGGSEETSVSAGDAFLSDIQGEGEDTHKHSSVVSNGDYTSLVPTNVQQEAVQAQNGFVVEPAVELEDQELWTDVEDEDGTLPLSLKSINGTDERTEQASEIEDRLVSAEATETPAEYAGQESDGQNEPVFDAATIADLSDHASTVDRPIAEATREDQSEVQAVDEQVTAGVQEEANQSEVQAVDEQVTTGVQEEDVNGTFQTESGVSSDSQGEQLQGMSEPVEQVEPRVESNEVAPPQETTVSFPQSVQVTSPQETATVPLKRVPRKPEKPGFWRRLFGFGRRK